MFALFQSGDEIKARDMGRTLKKRRIRSNLNGELDGLSPCVSLLVLT
jgi:hypothetical protein